VRVDLSSTTRFQGVDGTCAWIQSGEDTQDTLTRESEREREREREKEGERTWIQSGEDK